MESDIVSAVVEGSQYVEIIKLMLNLGPIIAILVLGFLGKQQIDTTLKQYREDMLEQRKMYESNVELVKRALSMADDLKDIVILNTQAMTRLVDRIDRGAK